jgi:hypothetical protein
MTAGHSEKTALQAALDEDVLNGAKTYLSFGPAPINELTRVLSEHLGTARPVLNTAVMALVADGVLNYSGSKMVSLPAGGDTRDTTKEK